MEIKFKDVGDNRWLCWVHVPIGDRFEFEKWLTDTLQDRYMIRVFDHSEMVFLDLERDKIVYEIRGGSKEDATALAMRWK